MKGLTTTFKSMTRWAVVALGCSICLIYTTQTTSVEAAEGLGGPPHIGTFEGGTTFMTTSRNGINPGLYLEVMDAEGNYTEYTSEDGVITVSGTKEGAYVTQAKLLGKTKYVDQITGEILDQWEEGRNLDLVSSEGPGLTTVGKNLFPYGDVSFTPAGFNWYDALGTENMYGNIGTKSKSRFLLKKGTYTFSTNNRTNVSIIQLVDDDENIYITGNGSFTLNKNTYLTLRVRPMEETSNSPLLVQNIQIENGSVSTAYTPYQTNLIAVQEAVTLRGVGKVSDELDLITGEMTKNIDEIVLDGSEDWVQRLEKDNTLLFQTNANVVTGKSHSCLSDKFPYRNNVWSSTVDQEGVLIGGLKLTQVDISIAKNKLHSSDVMGFKAYLQSNPTTVQYELETNLVKTLSINSTYYFKPVLNREIVVNGVILPLVASVDIPTEPLTFILDPNQTEDQQFIAPEFKITNHAPAAIELTLKTFEQTTPVLNDVLPEAHPDWDQLDKHQSKDMALALVPKPSEGWLSLEEGPRYVADKSNYRLGEVRKGSTVEFTFSALHGQAFVEGLTPQYRLAFEFGF